jgi:hypothetical protein
MDKKIGKNILLPLLNLKFKKLQLQNFKLEHYDLRLIKFNKLPQLYPSYIYI